MRADWEGPYVERLSMEPAAVDLSQFKGGPVLDNHDRFSGVRSILGIVEDASVDGKRGVASVRFSERPEFQGVVSDVQNGIIRNVSAGYQVQKWEISKRADGVRIKTATRWIRWRFKFTPLAADAGAQTRSRKVNEELQTQIRSLTQLSGLPGEFAEGLITRNVGTIEEARTAVFTEMARKAPAIQSQAPAVVTREAAPDEMVRHMSDALYARFCPTVQLSEQARPFAGRRMADMARELLRIRGLSTLGSDAEIITRTLASTSDFPSLLSNVANKILQQQYQAAPSGMKTVCRRATVNEFKPRYLLRRGEMPTLESARTASSSGARSSRARRSTIGTFGKVFGITRQTLINDDLERSRTWRPGGAWQRTSSRISSSAPC